MRQEEIVHAPIVVTWCRSIPWRKIDLLKSLLAQLRFLIFNFILVFYLLFLFQRSGLEAETLSLKVPTCIFGCESSPISRNVRALVS